MTMSDAHARGVWYPALDGLRGLAALWVLLGHVAQPTLYNRLVWILLNNGLAVDLFMLLSGFLMYSIHEELSEVGIIDFWLKRFFRLAPLYYVCLIASFVLTPWFLEVATEIWSRTPHLHGWPVSNSIASFVAHPTFLFGLSPALQQSTLLPDWSLTLEAQFYLAFPFILMAMKRFGVLRSLVPLLFVQVGIFYLFRDMFVAYVFPSVLPLKLHVFLAGMLIAAFVKGSTWGAGYLTLATLCVVLPVPSFSLSYSICRVAMIGIVLFCTKPLDSKLASAVRFFFSMRIMRWAGDMSYAVYLVHTAIMYWVLSFLVADLQVNPLRSFLVVSGVTLVFSYALAAILHRLIEVPGIHFGRELVRGRAARTCEEKPPPA